jgi:hypothetical protein
MYKKCMPEFMKNIDWELLKKQKMSLLEIQEMTCFTKEDQENMTGIVNLLDALQDYAVDVVGLSEKQVFNLSNQVWNVNEINTLLIDMGQESMTFDNGGYKGTSMGDYGRVGFFVLDPVDATELRLVFETEQLAKVAFNALSDALTNPYEFYSRFDEMPTVIMVRFTEN